MKPRRHCARVLFLIAIALSSLGCQHPAHDNPFLICVRAAESDTSNGYRAENPTSTASGAYQFIDGTWRHVAPMAGVHGISHASDASPFAQDQVAAFTISHSRKLTGGYGNWNGDHCGHGT